MLVNRSPCCRVRLLGTSTVKRSIELAYPWRCVNETTLIVIKFINNLVPRLGATFSDALWSVTLGALV
jgi:hypothetical protein